MENCAERAASLMKSPMSVESDHWYILPLPLADVLRNEIMGVDFSRAKEDVMSRATCERGWEGCSRNTVGGFVFVFESERILSSGSISLNRCEDVGDIFPRQSFNKSNTR